MLVVKQDEVRQYELTYLVGAAYTTAEINSIKDEIVSLVGRADGEIVETQEWGKKELAYVIKKDGKRYNEALYMHLIVKMPASKARDFIRSVELKREVIRSLLVEVDASVAQPANDDKSEK